MFCYWASEVSVSISLIGPTFLFQALPELSKTANLFESSHKCVAYICWSGLLAEIGEITLKISKWTPTNVFRKKCKGLICLQYWQSVYYLYVSYVTESHMWLSVRVWTCCLLWVKAYLLLVCVIEMSSSISTIWYMNKLISPNHAVSAIGPRKAPAIEPLILSKRICLICELKHSLTLI